MMKRNSELTASQERYLAIATDTLLSPKQKANFLALEAENSIPYLSQCRNRKSAQRARNL